MTDDVDRLFKRFERARNRRSIWDTELADAFLYAGAQIDSGFQTAAATPGANRTRRRYDDTAAVAARDAAATLHSTVVPAHERFIAVELAAAAAAEIEGTPDEQVAAAALEQARDRFFDALNGSNFHHVIPICLEGVMISSACLGFYEDSAPSRLQPSSSFRFEAIPLHEVYPERSYAPRRRSIWRVRRMAVDDIAEVWPAAKLSDALVAKRAAADGGPGGGPGGDDVDIVEAALWDRQARNFRYLVAHFEDKTRSILYEQRQTTSPFILFGGKLAPGELLHRGRVLEVLSDIRTLNKTVELILKNASIAVTGMWQADDDGVINIANIKLQPGAIIPKAVGSAGLQPLQAPGRFDVAQFILADLRERIELAIKGRQARPADKSHIAATSAMIDIGEVNLERMPWLLSLWTELVVPLFERGNDILARRGKSAPIADIGGDIRLKPVSPLMLLQGAAEVERANAALAPQLAFDPEGVRHRVDLGGYHAWALERAGFPVEFIKPEDEAREAEDSAAEVEQAGAAAEMAGRAAPAIGQMLKLVEGGGQ